MERLTDKRINHLIFFFTGFLSGLILSAIFVTAYIGHSLDKSYEQINYLQTAIKEKDVRLLKLEDASKQKKYIIKKIDVELQLEGEEFEKSALIKYIKERYYILFGKEVKDVDPDLIVQVIDNRVVHLDGRSYKLVVQKLLLSEVLKAWVTATLL